MTVPTPDTHPDVTTREAWLERAIAVYFRPVFEQIGYTMPERIHVSVGWGAGRAGRESKHIAGQCWSGVASEDSAPHVFISPMLSDPTIVLMTLAHQLVHATLDPVMDHGHEFRRLATALGLVAPFTECHADSATGAAYMLLTQPGGELGPYPHSALSVLELPARATVQPEPATVGGATPMPKRVSSGPATQGVRHVKAVCPDHPDAMGVRTSRTYIESGRGPLCGEPAIADETRPCGRRLRLPESI